MLLTITTKHSPGSNLGLLLHKHPNRFQSFDLSFGRAHVFYPQVEEHQATFSLMLDVDPVALVRKQGQSAGLMDQYVNDRPYVAGSFLSVAISQVLGSALAGRQKDHPDLPQQAIPLEVCIEVLPVRGGVTVEQIFVPLGYSVSVQQHPLDERFPEWGDSPYYSVTLSATKTISELLSHLYVLMPVFDDKKHYYVGADELDKLLEKGSGWLADHPHKSLIARRYLKYRSGLIREALARLCDVDDQPDETTLNPATTQDTETEVIEPAAVLTLNEQRYEAVLSELKRVGARRVLDLGCGEGKFLKRLLEEKQFVKIVGMDVSIQSLERASDRLRLDTMPERVRERIELLHGSLVYRDRRLEGFDAAAVIEVIEHLDASRLKSLERSLFEYARPKTIVITTPNREYNVVWESLPAETFRHADHRFEWSRTEFETWCKRVSESYGYRLKIVGIGPVSESYGMPTQMGVFERDG